MALSALRVDNNSLVISALVNGKPVDFVLDTGDAIGPTFNAADAARIGLPQGAAEGVEGAGGASSVYATTASIRLGSALFDNEPGAVDPDLDGPSLLGLPFFLAKGGALILDWADNTLLIA